MRTLIFTVLALAFGVQLGRAEATWSSYLKTNRYDFTMTDEEIAKTPVWRESDEHPPLPARKALRLARACLTELLVIDSRDWSLETLSWKDDPGDWSLESLRLKELRDGHWVYLAVFHAPLPPGGLNGMPVSMTIPVMMSGVAVKPKVSRWPR